MSPSLRLIWVAKRRSIYACRGPTTTTDWPRFPNCPACATNSLSTPLGTLFLSIAATPQPPGQLQSFDGTRSQSPPMIGAVRVCCRPTRPHTAGSSRSRRPAAKSRACLIAIGSPPPNKSASRLTITLARESSKTPFGRFLEGTLWPHERRIRHTSVPSSSSGTRSVPDTTATSASASGNWCTGFWNSRG